MSRGVRFAAFLALAAFGATHWAGQLDPAPAGRMLAMVLAVAGGAAAIALSDRLHGRWRVLGLAGAIAATVVVQLRLAGVPAGLLLPADWDVLASGLGQGIEALPGIRIPYRGADEWTRIVLLSGGGALVALAGALAFWPGGGRPLAAAVVLGCFYAVPVIERDPGSPYLDGLAFALLLAAFLWAERLRGREAALAAGLLLVAGAVALAAAPRVDASKPWLDYEQIAESLEERTTTVFNWNHRYDPLNWPREGKEVLRVKARRAAYWKAVVLEEFDGIAWRQSRDYTPVAPGQEPARRRAWTQRLSFVVKGLRSRQYVSAGTTEVVRADGGLRVERSNPGTFVTGRRPLRRGDTYRTRAYIPNPDDTTLRDAGSDYPELVGRQMFVHLPASNGPPPALPAPGRQVDARPVVEFPLWGSDEPVIAIRQFGFRSGDGIELVRSSPYRRIYDLAQRIKSGSRDPYDFVRAVQRRVRGAATYSEAPPRRRFPLDAFLFTDKKGYCQQFSGAMALMLRMGGIPARVASGFTPGTLDRERDEYVVRDLDAHSWVEAYFPGIGWVPFDPTPADAPARSQATSEALANASGGDASDAGGAGDRGSDPAASGAGNGSASASRWLIAGGPLLAIALLLGGAAFVRRRRAAAAARDVPSELAELHRALTRSGRTPERRTTLAQLERTLGAMPEACAYVRALRLGRYGGSDSQPSPRERRALRRALGEGLGWGGRLRAWWALPPHVRDAFKERRLRPYTG